MLEGGVGEEILHLSESQKGRSSDDIDTQNCGEAVIVQIEWIL